MTERAEYLLGMEPAEVRRLERQHAVWRDVTTKVWDLAGFSPGQTVIDLGCGPGFAAVGLAQRVGPQGRVVAVDSSAQALDQCRARIQASSLQNVEVCEADVTRFDPSPWRADGVFARWLFSYLAEPEAVVETLASGLHPGAVVAVMDYWNYLSIQTQPAHPLFKKAYQAVYASLADTGGSFDAAGRLPGLLARAGFEVTALEPFCRTGRPGSPLWSWLDDFQSLHLRPLVDKGYLSREDLEAFFDWWGDLEQDPGAFMFAPPVLAVVAVKRG